MKKFILRILGFLFFFLILTHLLFKFGLLSNILIGKEVYTAIEISHNLKNNTKILVSGDSVARQLFSTMDDKFITSIACNQSIDLIGHYLLIENALSSSGSIIKIYFLYNPFSLINDLNHKYTYNYFLKPFNNDTYIKKFTLHALKQIKKIPYSEISDLTVVKISNFTPNYSGSGDTNQVMSLISYEYLNKIIEVSRDKNIEFTILSPPIRESRKEEIKQLIKNYQLSPYKMGIIDEYFERIVFLPDSLYQDEIHFKNKFLLEVRKKVISMFNKD